MGIGDAVIDLIPLPRLCNMKRAGGAPVNVAAGVTLRAKQWFWRVGGRSFWAFMQKTLFDIGVDTSAMEFDESIKTSTVLVSLHTMENDNFFDSRLTTNLRK